MSLFEALANGPLMGGGEDAIERVKRLSGGDEVEIVQGISCTLSDLTPIREGRIQVNAQTVASSA